MRWTDSRMFYVNARAEGPSLVLNLDTGSEASRFHTKVRWPRGRVAGHTVAAPRVTRSEPNRARQ